MEKPKELPTGIGEKFQKERGKERVPVLKIANSVLWVNPAFPDLPFKLEEGEPTNLGMFFAPKLPELPPEPRYKKFLRLGKSKPKEKRPSFVVMPEDVARSALLGSVIFRDMERRIYRDIDIKGLGRFIMDSPGSARKGDVGPKHGNPREAWGLHDYHYAYNDRRYSEQFLEEGIRTYRIVAVIDLKEIIDNEGNKISIKEAKLKKIISEEMQPVLEIRAFSTKERVSYLMERNRYASLERKRLALEDAKAMIAQELGIEPENFSYADYLNWFAKTLGEQVAKIQKLGLVHGYLTNHNISLDCRIVDLDSVKPPYKWRGDGGRYHGCSDADIYSGEFLYGRDLLANLLISVAKIIQIPEITNLRLPEIYGEAFKQELARSKEAT